MKFANFLIDARYYTVYSTAFVALMVCSAWIERRKPLCSVHCIPDDLFLRTVWKITSLPSSVSNEIGSVFLNRLLTFGHDDVT